MKKNFILSLTFFVFCLFGVLLTTELVSSPIINEGEKVRYNDLEIAERFNLTLDQVHRLHRMCGLTNEAIAVLPPKKLAKSLRKIDKPKPTHPGEYVTWRAESLKDEHGFIDPAGVVNAVNHTKRMAVPINRVIWGQPPVDPNNPPPVAGINKDNWTWLGPGNIGGRLRSIIIHPTSTNTMWVGSIAGGIWKTTDGGTNWAVVDDFMTNIAVCSMIMDPTNSNIMYAGTGEGFYNADAIQGAGVFKSTDGGTTWTQLPSTTSSSWYYVNRLAINSDASVILAATRSNLYRSTDGGTSWSSTFASANFKGFDVRFDPSNNNKAVASGMDYDWGLLKWVYRAYYSTNGGATWTAATGLADTGRIEVAYSPSNSTIVYASAYDNSGRFYRSTDGGMTYSQMSTGYNYLGGQGWYDNVIWVDPTNPNTVIVGGIDLWRSTNSGVTFTQISQWWNAPSSAHADHHFIVEHPNFDGVTNKTVFFANDGGIYKTDDVYTVVGTTGWQELNNNLGVTQFYGAAGNPASGVIVGGTQDNGTLRYSGSTEGWTAMFGGDGGWCAFDQTDSNYAYGEYIYLMLHRSTNGGLSSSYIYSGITDAGSSAEFIAPFILDPNDQARLLAGGTSLWRTTNAKAPTVSWSSIKSSIGSNITAIAVAPGNSDNIWVGHRNGNVYKTSNGTSATPSWSQVDTGTPNLPNRRCQRITIDPNNNNLVYVTFGGYSADNVYKTTDAGATWSDITGAGATGLPNAPVRTLVIHPQDSNWLYAGTEVGIFASDDAGVNWSTTNDGPTNCSVDELFWLDNTTLVAASHGRGLFKNTVVPTNLCGSISGTLTVANSPYTVTCNIQVDAGQSLVIESGVVLNGLDNFTFTSNGQLTWHK